MVLGKKFFTKEQWEEYKKWLRENKQPKSKKQPRAHKQSVKKKKKIPRIYLELIKLRKISQEKNNW